MPTHKERKLVPYRAEQMFDLVADVARYPEFLPWCVGARVLKRQDAALAAELTIGFGPFRESFTSHVVLEEPTRVHVGYENGPFRYLRNEWRFAPTAHGCQVDFFVDFEFRSRILQSAIGLVFAEAVRRMVTSFLTRAGRLYGPAVSSKLEIVRPKPCG